MTNESDPPPPKMGTGAAALLQARQSRFIRGQIQDALGAHLAEFVNKQTTPEILDAITAKAAQWLREVADLDGVPAEGIPEIRAFVDPKDQRKVRFNISGDMDPRLHFRLWKAGIVNSGPKGVTISAPRVEG